MRSLSTTKLGIVSPVYNESEGIRDFISTMVAAVESLGLAGYELLLIDDGSRDDSVSQILEEREKNPSISLLKLSRNFGHQSAVTAGLSHVQGDVVLVIDADLQDPPELVAEMLENWIAGDEVIFAQRTSRQENGIRRIGFELFHRFFHYFIEFNIPNNIGVFGLLDRRAVDEINALQERNRFLPGLHSWVGFQQGFVKYDRADRAAGEPSQTFKSLFKYAIDGVLSFSYKPIRMIGAFGTAVAAFSFLLIGYFLIKRIMGIETAFIGFTTIVILISLLGGITLMALALIGEFVARIYDEVKGRPMFIVDKIVRHDKASQPLKSR